MEHVMSMAAGILQQAGSGGLAGGGNPAEIIVRVRSNGHLVTLRPARMRAVADADLIKRLRDVVGQGAVWIIPASPQLQSRNGHGRPQWQRQNQSEMAGA